MRSHAFQDLSGQVFGRLTVLDLHSIDKVTRWRCKCACGRIAVVLASQLKTSRTRSCGCLRRENGKIAIKKNTRPPIDITGEKSGRLVAIKRVKTEKGFRWKCRCDCGQYSYVSTTNWGHTKSCGCGKRNRGGRTHRAERITWYNMKQRCYNQKYTDYGYYGGRGIRMCDAWKNSFDAFFLDMGSRPSNLHSIDRIDNDGNYEPGNCRWVTQTQQTRNQSKTRWLEFRGQSKPMPEWAEHFGMSYTKLRRRLNLGWDVEKALTTA